MSLLRRAVETLETRGLWSFPGIGDYGSTTGEIPGPADGHGSFAGRTVTPDRSMQVIDVYKCVTLITDALAMLPIHAYRDQAIPGDPLGRTNRVKVTPQPALVRDPFPEIGRPSWVTQVHASLLLAGDTFNIVGAVDRHGTPTVLVPLPPDEVRDVYRDQGTVIYALADGRRLRQWRRGSGRVGDMVHWPAWCKPGALRGMSAIAAGREGIGLSMAAEEYGARWFGDSAVPSGWLELEEDPGDAGAALLQRRWMEAHGGRRRKPAVMAGAKFHNVQVNPEESQFLETRRYQTAQIAGLFRVPPHMVSDVDRSTSWGTGIEEQGLGFATYTLQHWVTRLELAFTALLPRDQYVKVTLDALFRGRLMDRYRAYAIARQWGWMSVNDIRTLEDLPIIDGGDTYLQPLNMVDTTKALEAILKDEADPAPPPAFESDRPWRPTGGSSWPG